MTEHIPLILDVDTGIDDSLALLYACASPEVELLAATCVAGNVEVDQVVANTLAVLALAGRSDVPVVRGRERPLVKPLETTRETHGPHGIGFAEPPPPRHGPDPGEAADRIVDLVRARPGEILLVTLGPLTNLAVALEREPALPRLLRGWTLMGGAYRVPGNTTPTTEWNMHVDPDAAKASFAAWAAALDSEDAGSVSPPLAMGLDVTERVPFLEKDLERLARRGASPRRGAGSSSPAAGAVSGDRAGPIAAEATSIVRFVADALRYYFEFHARNDGFYGAYIHDPFALAAALDRSLVKTVPVFVDVETQPGLTQGMTIADWRGHTRRPPNVEVAVDARGAAFIERFIDRVGGLAADRATVAR